MAQFEQDMNKARATTSTAVRYIVGQFNDMNRDIGIATAASSASALSVASSWGQSALRIASAIGVGRLAIVGFALAVGAALAEGRQQIEEMVDIGNRANKAGVSSEFLQAFLADARKLKVEAKELEGALTHAFSVTKDQLDQMNPVLAKLRDFYLAGFFTAADTRTGLDLFRNADTQEDRVRAILVAMIELDRIGQHVASLNIGEQMFGSTFVDRIRQGNTSATELLATVDRLRAGGVASGEIFSNQLVARAAEVDIKLKQAHETLERNLRPAWDGLADVALTIKNVWADIVGLLGRAASVASIFGRAAAVARDRADLADVESRIASGQGAWGLPQTDAGRRQLLNQRNTLQNRLNTSGIGDADARAWDTPTPSAGVPTPRSRPGDAPAAREEKEVADVKTAFESQIESINRHVAALEADAAAVGKTAGEHERLRVEMSLLQALARDGIITDDQVAVFARLRGEMNTLNALQGAGIQLTTEQAGAFAKVADRATSAAEKLRLARDNFSAWNDVVKFGGNQIIDIIDRATQKGAKLVDIAADLARTLGKALLQASLLGEGPLAGLLGTRSSVTGGTGGLLGSLVGAFAGSPGGGGVTDVYSPGFNANAFGGPRAGGGPVSPSKWYMVGERGPEAFVPHAPGSVVPAGGGGGNLNVQIINQNGSRVEARSKADPGGGQGQLLQVVISELENRIAQGGSTSRVIAGRFGLNPMRGR